MFTSFFFGSVALLILANARSEGVNFMMPNLNNLTTEQLNKLLEFANFMHNTMHKTMDEIKTGTANNDFMKVKIGGGNG